MRLTDKQLKTVLDINWKQLHVRGLNYRVHPRTGEVVYVKDYDKMPKRLQDNTNPVTGMKPLPDAHHGSKVRIPSKKRKNKYKNFLKLFPWYATAHIFDPT